MLFDQATERRPFDIQKIALDTDVAIFNMNWGEGRSYYADFCGLGYKYAPMSILEIGVRYGYSGLAICQGTREAGRKYVNYTGMDWEGVAYRSNGVAKENFLRFEPSISVAIHFINTQLQTWPAEVLEDQYDFINVDGDHSFEGALKDMGACWSLLLPGGIMTVDDCAGQEVMRAVETFMGAVKLAGEPFDYQMVNNERMLAVFRKGSR